MEERKQSVRIQTSILNGPERKLLVYLAERLPEWVTSDMLTFLGTIGAVIIAIGYALSNYNLNWLWLASFGFLVNWFGDSLDGSLARVRKQQRPLYGFFLDHTVDCLNETIMFIGVGLSPLLNITTALFVLVTYLLLSVYVYIAAHLKNEFKLTYVGLGPTEFRIIVVIVNTLFIFIKPLSEIFTEVTMLGTTMRLGIFDFIGLFIGIIIFLMFFVSVINDARYFAKIDPLKKEK